MFILNDIFFRVKVPFKESLKDSAWMTSSSGQGIGILTVEEICKGQKLETPHKRRLISCSRLSDESMNEVVSFKLMIVRIPPVVMLCL